MRSQKDPLHIFYSFFPTTYHIIAISSKVSMEYIIIGDIKELASIGAVVGKDTVSAPPAEIILGDESFIGGRGGGISLFSFNSNWSLKDLFSSLNFDRAEYKAFISRLNMLFDDSIPFFIHSIVYSFELWSSFTRSNSSLRESISLGSDKFIWAGSSITPPITSKS